MNELVGSLLVAGLVAGPVPALPRPNPDLCTAGYTIMIPDGREAIVSSASGEICRVIATGEAYVTLLPIFLVEPVYPQNFAARAYSH